MLLSATRSEGTLAPKVDFVLLPDAKPVSLRGHYFEGNEQVLADVITKWLTGLHMIATRDLATLEPILRSSVPIIHPSRAACSHRARLCMESVGWSFISRKAASAQL
jgi:hypothetical protein